MGYGSGALGEIDTQYNKAGEIKLGSHPESFQLERDSAKIYVNLPKSRKVAVVDREKRSVIASWGTGMAFANYPMSLDEKDHRLFVVTRMPARLLVFNTDNGSIVQKLPRSVTATTYFTMQRVSEFTPSAVKEAYLSLSRRMPTTIANQDGSVR